MVIAAQLRKRIAETCLLSVIGFSIFGPTGAAQATTYVAVGETPVVGTSSSGGKWGGNYKATHIADGAGQQLNEASASGSMRLTWTYQFGGWTTNQTLTAFTIKGYAVNNRGNNESIDVYFSAKAVPDPNLEGDWSKLGAISSTASSNAQTFSLPNVPVAGGQPFHLRIADSLRTNDTASNGYRIDQMYLTASDGSPLGDDPPTDDPPGSTGPATSKEIIGYFTQWGIYGKGQIPKLTASGIPANKITYHPQSG